MTKPVLQRPCIMTAHTDAATAPVHPPPELSSLRLIASGQHPSMIAKHDQSPGVLFDKSSVDRPGRSQIVVAIEELLDAFIVLLEKLDRVFCNVGRHWPNSDGRSTKDLTNFSD